MNYFLILAFLFFIGSVSGWILELFFRRFISAANPERKWINPGFCTGPYLPIYGFGVCTLYLIAQLERYNDISNPMWNKAVLFLMMAVCMTVIEYFAGLISLKMFKVRLWDYSGEWGNIQGIICPRFSFFWMILGALYYFQIHPAILDALEWLSNNLAFSFVVGMFFGIFLIDASHSADVIVKLKQFAEENQVVLRYEAVKEEIRRKHEQMKKKYHFFRPLRPELPLAEYLKSGIETFEQIKKKIRN